MLTPIPFLVAVHALAGIYWAGSTFVLARSPEIEIRGLFASQLGAAVLVFASGAALWGLLHRGGFSAGEVTLATGIIAAVAALLTQTLLRSRPAFSNRVAAVLLAVTAATMVTWRFA